MSTSTRRMAALVIAIVCGVVAGAVVALARPSSESTSTSPSTTAARSAREAPAEAPNATIVAGSGAVPGSTPAPTPTLTTSPAPPSDPLLLAWMPSPLAEPSVERLRGDPVVERLTAVRRDEVGLVRVDDESGVRFEQPAGFEVPIDVVAFDAATYLDFVPPASAAAFTQLRPNQALLSTSGARVRGAGVGAVLTFHGGIALTVVGIVDDEVVGAAEVVVDLATGAKLGVTKVRYVLMTYEGARAEAEAAVSRVFAGPIRFRGPGETPYLRNADAVLPLVKVKQLFGEFSFRSSPALEQLPSWTETFIATERLPIIGAVRCHRGVLEALRGAMVQLQQEQLGYLVDPAMSQVCWRMGRIHDEARLTRQAWGIGFEINNATNPTGSGSDQDRRLVEIMQHWGFAWGGDWLIAEPSYFEYIGPPRP